MMRDLSYILNPVDAPSELDSGDYIVAVTSEAVYMDRVEKIVGVNSGYDLNLQDGVMRPEHSHLDLSRDLPSENPFDSNDVIDAYLVPDDVAPDSAYKEKSLVDAGNRLTP